MSPTSLSSTRQFGLSTLSERRIGVVILIAMALAAAAVLIPHAPYRNGLLAFASAAACLSAVVWLIGRMMQSDQQQRQHLISDMFQTDSCPYLYANADGEILTRNSAAGKRFAVDPGRTVSGALARIIANPEETVFQLQSQAMLNAVAQEDFATHNANFRLKVHRSGPDCFLWRLEDIINSEASQATPELATLLVDRDRRVIFVNETARSLLGAHPKTLDRVFTDLPVVSGTVTRISTKNGPSSFLICVADAGDGNDAYYLLPPGETDVSSEDWGVFQGLPVSLLKVDPDGHVLEYNRMAASLVGSLLERRIHLSDLMEGLGRPITDWLQEVSAGRGSQQTEFLRLKRNDKEAFVQVSLNCMQDAEGPALIAVLTDATELKTLEAQFVQSQKMQAIGQLAGGVAHDFNNLLTAISGHCDLLLLRHDQGDPDFSDLVQINQNANRAAALVGQLLAFSRKQTLRPETLDMRDTLSDLTHLLNRLVGEKVTLTLQHDPVLQPIRADKRQLEQVMMNLVVNARDAMPDGGEISILTEVTKLSEPLERDRVSVPAGNYVTVQVRDQGTGIPPDKLQKVFEPFYTTKRVGEGTGLGLSTVYGIVKQTGGYIFVDSKPGIGTDFTLYFPVIDERTPAAAPERISRTKSSGRHGDGVILLVEDEAPVRAFASRALRLRGYTVLEADSAESALKTLEDDTLTVDVFVTDVVMPGMDGPSWVREALKERPDVRVVFVSGYAEDSFGEVQTRIPNSVFLPKPFSLNDLTETVHKQLH